jgi:hypothetical protein
MKSLYPILLGFLTVYTLQAQNMRANKKNRVSYATQSLKSREENKFLEKQWWLGLKAGTNLTKANVTTSYSALSPTNYDPAETEKKYESFKIFGTQVTLEATFYFRQLSLSLQPTYRRAQFVYTNDYHWADNEDPGKSLTLNYKQHQKVDHVLIPFLIKFDLTATKLRPYLQAGAFAAFLVSANKSVTISGVDYASGGENSFADEPIIVGAKDLFAGTYYGMIGGGGINYHQGNVRLNLDIMYQYGMTNATSVSNRYSNDRLTGVGDIMDDLTMDNIVISLGCLFPLRFLGTSYKSLDKK